MRFKMAVFCILTGCTGAPVVTDEATRAAPILAYDLVSGDESDCIPASEFVLGDVRMGAPDSSLAAHDPISVTRSPLDESGTTWFDFGGLKVITLRERVAEIYADDAKWVTPSGLRVGVTRQTVLEVLGRIPDNVINGNYSIPVCYRRQGYFDEWFLNLTFGADETVSEVSFQTNWP